MAHGILHGIKHGIVHGAKQAGQLTLGGTDPFAGIDRDATSGKYYPANSSQWTQFIAAAGLSIANPNSLWLCQEASGNLADSIGALTLTANGTPGYNQAFAGHTRLAVSFSEAGSAQRFMAASGSGPNPTTTSSTWLMITNTPTTPAAMRTLGTISDTGATQFMVRLQTTPVIGVTVVGTTNNGGSNPTGAGAQPVAFKYDRTNSAAVVWTGQEKIVGTYNSGVLDGRKGFGSGASTNAAQTIGYGCMWSGANGEISDANMKALLQALGWTIPWS